MSPALLRAFNQKNQNFDENFMKTTSYIFDNDYALLFCLSMCLFDVITILVSPNYCVGN